MSHEAISGFGSDLQLAMQRPFPETSDVQALQYTIHARVARIAADRLSGEFFLAAEPPILAPGCSRAYSNEGGPRTPGDGAQSPASNAQFLTCRRYVQFFRLDLDLL